MAAWTVTASAAASPRGRLTKSVARIGSRANARLRLDDLDPNDLKAMTRGARTQAGLGDI